MKYFRYVICILGYLKIYQFRHPDAAISAYTTFALLGTLVLLEALVLYFTHWVFFALFLTTYVVLTIFWFVDQLYLGVLRLNLTKNPMSLWNNVRVYFFPSLRQHLACCKEGDGSKREGEISKKKTADANDSRYVMKSVKHYKSLVVAQNFWFILKNTRIMVYEGKYCIFEK